MAAFLWIAMKIVRVDGSFLALLLASVISILLGLIPYAGGILSFACLLYLLYQWTDMDSWLYGFFMVLIARALAMLAFVGIYGLIK